MAAPATHTFSVYQGQTWEETLVVNNPDGTPMNLTGFAARMHIRAEIGDAATIMELGLANERLLVSDAAAGELTLLVSAADTAALPLNFEPQTWVYDVEIYRASPAPEYVQRILQGSINASPEVTRA